MSILIIGKGLAAGALVSSALFAGTHATTATPSPSTTSTTCHPLWDKAPDALKADIESMRALPKGEQRREARHQIRTGARAGKYGVRVQQLAEHRKENRREIRKQLPADLKQDLRAARRLDGQDRRDALVKIRKAALAGDYGDKTQAFAEKRQKHRQDCRAQRPPPPTDSTS